MALKHFPGIEEICVGILQNSHGDYTQRSQYIAGSLCVFL